MAGMVGGRAAFRRQAMASEPPIVIATVKTFVGGAVVTAEYAREIGADFYTKDAMASVRLAAAENG